MILGDIGTVIQADTGESLSGGSGAVLHYRKPSGTTGSWSATIDGNKITYTTLASDLDEVGVWTFQGYVVLSAWTGRTETFSESVDTAI
jgi:hypothetical protein